MGQRSTVFSTDEAMSPSLKPLLVAEPSSPVTSNPLARIELRPAKIADYGHCTNLADVSVSHVSSQR